MLPAGQERRREAGSAKEAFRGEDPVGIPRSPDSRKSERLLLFQSRWGLPPPELREPSSHACCRWRMGIRRGGGGCHYWKLVRCC